MDTSPEPDDYLLPSRPPHNPYPSTPRQTASPRNTPRPQHHKTPTPLASLPSVSHHASTGDNDDDDGFHPPSTHNSNNPGAADDTKTTKQAGPASNEEDEDEDEEEDTRPNRWRGHPSTWLTWTERDRETWTALENVRAGDLVVHLYNAVGLRRGFRGEEGEEGAAKGWDFGKAWTAWPVEEPKGDTLLPRTADVNEGWTVRRGEGGRFAGSELEEEITAVMLREAKERFWKRGLEEKREGGGEEVMPSVEVAETEGEAEGETDGGGVTGKEEDEEGEDGEVTRKRKRSPSFTPVFSADDDRSYALLRPAARRIMGKLDDTLTILHNQRVAGLGNVDESSASDGEDTETEEDAEKSAEEVEEPRLRSLKKTTPPPRNLGGRPKKVQVPREGETEEQMLIRLAREGKRKLPAFARAESEDCSRSRSRSRSRSVSRSVSRGPRSVSVSLRASSRASSQASSSSSSASAETNKEKRLAR